jgi:deoxyhypusine synthase
MVSDRDLKSAEGAVKVKSKPVPSNLVKVEGYDFNKGVDLSSMLRDYYIKTGFQASSFGEAIRLVNEMVHTLSHIICRI